MVRDMKHEKKIIVYWFKNMIGFHNIGKLGNDLEMVVIWRNVLNLDAWFVGHWFLIQSLKHSTKKMDFELTLLACFQKYLLSTKSDVYESQLLTVVFKFTKKIHIFKGTRNYTNSLSKK